MDSGTIEQLLDLERKVCQLSNSVQSHRARKEEAEFIKRQSSVERTRRILRRLLLNALHDTSGRIEMGSNELVQTMRHGHFRVGKVRKKLIDNNTSAVLFPSDSFFGTYHSLIQFIQDGIENFTGDMLMDPDHTHPTSPYDLCPNQAAFSLHSFADLCNLLLVPKATVKNKIARFFRNEAHGNMQWVSIIGTAKEHIDSTYSIYVEKAEDYGAHTLELHNRCPSIGLYNTLPIFQMSDRNISPSRALIGGNSDG